MVNPDLSQKVDSHDAQGAGVSPLRVENVMVRGCITVSPSDNVKEAVARMSRHGIRHLIVTDNSGHVIGLLSQRDVFRYLARRFSETGEGPLQKVRDVMTRELLTIGPRELIPDAARRMVRERVGCLPVILRNGRLLGIVTRSDMLRVLEGDADLISPLQPAADTV